MWVIIILALHDSWELTIKIYASYSYVLIIYNSEFVNLYELIPLYVCEFMAKFSVSYFKQ